MDFEAYEKECEKIQEENEKYLELFEAELVEKGLSERTIHTHLNNVDFYINTFLLRCEPLQIDEGCYRIDDFLGEFFIRKCMWSTPGNIKTTAVSIKKFYACMAEKEIIDKMDYEILCDTIKDDIESWQEICRQFNDPYEENPFALF